MATGGDINVLLGKRVRVRRRLLGLTQQQLAVAIGVRFQQIQKYETGANRMSAARLLALAEALETPVVYFYAGLTAGISERARQEATAAAGKVFRGRLICPNRAKAAGARRPAHDYAWIFCHGYFATSNHNDEPRRAR